MKRVRDDLDRYDHLLERGQFYSQCVSECVECSLGSGIWCSKCYWHDGGDASYGGIRRIQQLYTEEKPGCDILLTDVNNTTIPASN